MTVVLRAMTDDEFGDWFTATADDYLAQRIRAGETADVARAKADEHLAAAFPDGRPGPGHRLWIAEADGATVGSVWVGPHPDRPGDPATAWLFAIEVDQAHRGRGLGRATLTALEAALAADGVSELGLNVFAGNDTARRLYATAGYHERAVSMFKKLS